MTGRTTVVANALRERIARGDLGPSGALESEAALGQRYGVSRVTVRRALEELKAQGLVESRPGAGWFATTFRQPLALGSFTHAGSAVVDAGKTLERHILAFAFEAADTDTAALLDLAPGREVLTCTSLRSVDGLPLDLVHEWVAESLGAEVSRRDAQDRGIWAALQGLGHPIDSVHQTISATVADAADAAALGTPAGAPLLLIRRLARDPQGHPVALSEHRYLAHRFSLEVEFHGWSRGADPDPPGLRAHPTTTQEHS